MKKSIVVSFIVLLSIVALFSSCSSISKDSAPSWLDNLYDTHYGQEDYLCAIGSGSSREKAVDAALSSLSQVFNSQVTSVTTVRSLSTAEEDRGGEVSFSEASEMFDQSSVTSATEKIVGAEVVNTYIDPNKRVYVRVALMRKRSAEIYQKEIFDLDRSIMDVRKRMITTEDPLSRYFTLHRAVGYAIKQQRLYDQIQVLIKKSQSSNLMILRRELDQIASSVSIAIRVDSDKGRERIVAAFSQKLVELGFTVVADEQKVTALVDVQYDSTPLNVENSPYTYERYTISATLYSGSTTLYSFQKSEREAAMSEKEASQKALMSASTSAVDEFFILLEETLGDR
jgi:hypothetical protein